MSDIIKSRNTAPVAEKSSTVGKLAYRVRISCRYTGRCIVTKRQEGEPCSVDGLAVGMCSVGEQKAGQGHVAVGAADV